MSEDIVLMPYDRDCPHCDGEGIVEHIGEGISEPCEHCSGTGRINKLSDKEIFKNNIFRISFFSTK